MDYEMAQRSLDKLKANDLYLPLLDNEEIWNLIEILDEYIKDSKLE